MSSSLDLVEGKGQPMADSEGARCSSTVVKLFVVLGGVGVLLTLILVPWSFGNVEYHQFAFVRRKSTSRVDLGRVYTSGKYLIGPDFEFKTFKADAHFVTLNSVRAFTADRLEVQLTVSFQYFLRKEDLPALHQAYDLYYQDVMKTSAVDALKGAVPSYTTREVFSKRSEVENAMYRAVRQRLGGVCCLTDCDSWEYACPKGCKSQETCENSDRGLFANVKYFQMGEVFIHNDVKERFLRALTLKEDAEKEKLLQDAQVERKITQSRVQNIKNRALEIKQTAEATSNLVQVESRANYTAIVEGARSTGLTSLYSRLNITSQEHKNSFDYLRTLRGLDNVHFTVNYQQNLIGTFPKS